MPTVLAVMAHPDGPVTEDLVLKYDWIDYFGYAFQAEEKPLRSLDRKLRVVDPHPCLGSSEEFLKSHYDIRGVPVFNRVFNEAGGLVFPMLKEQ